MSDVRLGCIADDYTGATDLSSMLVRAGLRVVQCFGVPDGRAIDDLNDADAIVIALKSRSIPALDAVEMSLRALQFLQARGMRRTFFKYCSTFDSTSDGNIGPVADALAEALGVGALYFCPSFPENGRTVHCGHLFVGGQPLHESGMRNHPLNPMHDSSLVRLLQAQSKRKVVSLSLHGQRDVSSPVHYVVDAIDDAALRRVAKQAAGHVLLSGASAIAGHWAQATGVRRSGGWPGDEFTCDPKTTTVILAGSCSEATRCQIDQFEQSHPVRRVSVEAAFDVQRAVSETLLWCDQQWKKSTQPILICSSPIAATDGLHQQYPNSSAMTTRVEKFFARLAVSVRRRGITRLIVAGGETSGAVINALDIDSVRIGPEIATGVSWVRSTGSDPMELALKSGNFGGPRFFLDALQVRS